MVYLRSILARFGQPIYRHKDMTAKSPSATLTIGQRLQSMQQAQFVGRQVEQKLFESALKNGNRSWQILNIHGPGGIGKSTLLDSYQRISQQLGAHFIYLDSVNFTDSSDVFLSLLLAQLPPPTAETNPFEQITQLAGNQQLVIAIDSYEDIGDLDNWIREQFIAQLPSSCIIIIAGRHALTKAWHNHPAWQQLVLQIPLSNFDLDQTQNYLQLHGVDSHELVQQLWHYTDGYPLALSLGTLLAQQEGEQALEEFSQNSNIIGQLCQRWLRELRDDNLRPLVQASALVRNFNQDMLQHILATEITAQQFEQLVQCSFIRRGAGGWSMHSLVRQALSQELAQRAPETYQSLRVRTLHTLAQAAIQLSNPFDKANALQEFFYQLGDSLVRAALYSEDIEQQDDERRIEPADASHIVALDDYMREWRTERGVLANTSIKLIDSSTHQSIEEEVVSEPREPELLNLGELIELFPGCVRVLVDSKKHIEGLSIVLPINADSIDYLKEQAVVKHYFAALDATELAQLSTPIEQTNNWFVRLIDVRNPADNSARAILFRDLAAMLIRPACFITSTPLKLYQILLTRFGFVQMDIAPQYDFGKDRAAPYFKLDLRGERLGQHLNELIKTQIGVDLQLPIDTLLQSIPQTSNSKPSNDALDFLDNVTAREKEVLELAVEGEPNCSIARRLDISEITVKKHMSRIFAKLAVRNRAELTKLYWSKKKEA